MDGSHRYTWTWIGCRPIAGYQRGRTIEYYRVSGSAPIATAGRLLSGWIGQGSREGREAMEGKDADEGAERCFRGKAAGDEKKAKTRPDSPNTD